MFKKFLVDHSLSEYDLGSMRFPDITDREYWEAFKGQDYVAEAEKAIDFDWPVIKATDFMEFKKSGDRQIMERAARVRRLHLSLFALAELIENKGRFLPQIVNGMFAICEESFWGLSAHWADEIPKNIPTPADPYIDLFAGETAEHIVMIAYLLREPLEKFCPEILERVEYELECRIKTPYLAHRDYWWMGYGKRIPNNWNPWIISNVMTVFLLTEKNRERLNSALEKMLVELQHYCDGIPDDGGCDEGANYWGRAGASLFECLYQLKVASGGKIDFFTDQKIKNIGRYLKIVHISKDYFANVADAHHASHAQSMLLNFAYARECGDEDLMNFCAYVWQNRSNSAFHFPTNEFGETLRRIFYHREILPELESYNATLPIHNPLEILPHVELAAIRHGDLTVFAKGGHNNESHNHNDIGNFELYDNENAVIADIGIGVYTKFTFSKHRYDMIPWVKGDNHNIPIINGVPQQYGKQYRADAFVADDKKIEISFGSAYPLSVGVKSLKRALSFTDGGMKCVDSFEFADGARAEISEVLISVLPVRIEGNDAILGEKYRIKANASSVYTEYLPFEDAPLENSWKTKGMTRIVLEFSGISTAEILIDTL